MVAINSHKSPFLKQFTICFYLDDLRVLTRWLPFAFSRRVESLKLDFSSSHSILDHDILSSIKRFFLFRGETMIQFAKAAAKFEFLNLELLRPKSFPVPQMPQLKKLVLSFGSLDRVFMLPVIDVLQASPCLQEFTIKNEDIGYYMLEFPFANIFEVPKLGKVQQSCLRAFEFEGFCGKIIDHMELLMYIVRNCAALERITVVPLPPIGVEESDKFRNCWDFLERNPYHYAVSLHSAVAARQERASVSKIKRCTVARLLAAKIPHHIKVVVV